MAENQKYLFLLDIKAKIPKIGSKATNLQRLQRSGMRTPLTYVLTWDAYEHYMQNDPALYGVISTEISKRLPIGSRYAVRSSASIEDSFEHSFAGQFVSILNVQGLDNLLQAIWTVWATAQSPEVESYLQKRKIDRSQFQMAVIIQEMVEPVFSGVSFSRNPMTGVHETVVEAVNGPGTLLMQEGVTPLRWIYHAGLFTSRPDSNDIPDDVVQLVIDSTVSLAKQTQSDLDLEWVYNGKDLYWVQMREITTLHDIPVYSNRISREMMAGIIKPLIWSVNIPLVNGVWIRLLTEVIGPNQLTPEQLARSFYYRTYFNIGLLGKVFEDLGLPAESLEMMWGIASKGSKKFKFKPTVQMMRLTPRILRFLKHKWSLANHLETRLPMLESNFHSFRETEINQLPAAALLDKIDGLFHLLEEVAYYNVVLPLSMYVYNSILRSEMTKIGVDYASLDMQQDTPEFLRFSPTTLLNKLNARFQKFELEEQERIRASTYQQVVNDPGLGDFCADLRELMEKFGHLSDNGNDFSSIPWRENGDMLLKLVMDNSNNRNNATARLEPGNRISFDSLRLPFWKGWMLRRLFHQTRRFNLYREHISYIYTYGYGLFRLYFLALGTHFVNSGLLDDPQDIFFLDHPTIRKVVLENPTGVNLREKVSYHRQAIDQVRDVQLPAVIYGDQEPPLDQSHVRKLTGTPSSRGYCSGKIKVVTGLKDFAKVETGDVLVIPYSDVGWSPLFSRVSGVIAESGGMLSHSSIIAREYGIPAIVSVPGATQLTDGTLVRIDGYRGEVTVIDEDNDLSCQDAYQEKTEGNFASS